MSEFQQLPRSWKQSPLCLALLGLLFLASIGCGDSTPAPPVEEPTPGIPAPETPAGPMGPTLLLQVVDDAGTPVAGAAVSSQGALFPVDSSGHLLLENLQPGRLLARVDALGFTSATTVVELKEGTHAGAQVKLLPLANPIPFQAEQGGTIQTPQVHVTIPPDAVVDALGQPVTGTVEVTIAPLDPTTQLASMPGPLEGTRVVGGETVQLESFFMAEVSLWSNGAPVQLAPGKSATLEFVLPEALASQFHAGDRVPAWWFDLDEGQWREEGEGTIQTASARPDRLAWVVTVNHFTWWNCDAPWTDKSCVNVLVVDGKGVPVSGAAVNAQGTSYSGESRPEYTGADGRACIEIKRGNTANVFAGLRGKPNSDIVAVTGTDEAAVCGSGPCTEVRLTLPDIICTPGAYETCAYAGPAGTEGKGLCRAGRRQCNVIGTQWSACVGEVTPAAESCRTPFDDDCDGEVNEECTCSDQQGVSCYGGLSGTQGVGICHGGTVACDLFGNVVCQGQQLPRPEMCSTLADDDCDGSSTECEPASQWFWTLSANATGCTSSTKMVDMAVDGEGNTLLLSSLIGTVTLGGAVFTGDEKDLLLVKVDTNGQPAWARLLDFEARPLIGSSSQERLTVDATGSVVVVGRFSGTLGMDGRSLVSTGSSDSFVAKFAPNGSLLWTQRFGGDTSSESSGEAVATDAAGNVALVRLFNGTFNIGSTAHTAANRSFYVAKLDAGTGDSLWSRSIIRSSDSGGYDSATEMDEAGDVLVAARFTGTVDIDGTVLTTTSWSPNVFVTKLAGTTGSAHWSQSMDAPIWGGHDKPRLKAAEAGTVLVLTASGSEHKLAKLSADGPELWSQVISRHHSTPDTLNLGLDATGNALVSGTFTNNLALGGGIRQSGKKPAAFVAWYDPQGRYLKDHVYPVVSRNGAGTPVGASVGVRAGATRSGHVLLGGWFEGSVDFGMEPEQASCPDSFLLKIDPTPDHLPPDIIRASSSSDTAAPGQVLTYEVEAKDPEGSPLTFFWAATTGSSGTPATSASKSGITWTAPSCVHAANPPTITVTVTNAFNVRTTRTFAVTGLPACWASTGSMLSPRKSHKATLLSDGRVLVTGGLFNRTAEVYDPATGSWSDAGSMSASRSSHTATLLLNGKVLVTGGNSDDETAEVYDPATNTWSAVSSMSTSRSSHTATPLPGGKVLVAGGYGGTFVTNLRTAEVYDPIQDTGSPTDSRSDPRSEHTATPLSDGRVLITGGVGGMYGGSVIWTGEVYDPVTATWSTTNSMVSQRSRYTATLLSDGKVLVTGGYPKGAPAIANAEVYAPATNTWSAVSSMALPRGYHAATLLPNGKVLITGGIYGYDDPVEELYDPATGTWSAVGPMTTARYSHTATLLLNGKVLITGGQDRSQSIEFETAELYTP